MSTTNVKPRVEIAARPCVYMLLIRGKDGKSTRYSVGHTDCLANRVKAHTGATYTGKKPRNALSYVQSYTDFSLVWHLNCPSMKVAEMAAAAIHGFNAKNKQALVAGERNIVTHSWIDAKEKQQPKPTQKHGPSQSAP